MITHDNAYDADLKKAVEEVSKIMEDLGTVHDGIQIHVNHFGQWVAKYRANDGTIYYAFGHDLLTSLKNLKDEPNKER